jgi:hypothetical protein
MSSLCLIKHHDKTYGKAKLQLHAFLTSALDRGEWSASRPGRLTPLTGSYWIYPVMKQNCIHEENKSILNSENACYHALQNLLYFRLPSKTLKLIIHDIIILPAVLYVVCVYESWCSGLRT